MSSFRYGFDAAGNLWTLAPMALSSQTFNVDALNQLSTVTPVRNLSLSDGRHTRSSLPT